MSTRNSLTKNTPRSTWLSLSGAQKRFLRENCGYQLDFCVTISFFCPLDKTAVEHRFLLAKCLFMQLFFQIRKIRLHILPSGDCTLGDGVSRGLVKDHYPRNETLNLTSRSVPSVTNRKRGTLVFFANRRNVELVFLYQLISFHFHGSHTPPFQR